MNYHWDDDRYYGNDKLDQAIQETRIKFVLTASFTAVFFILFLISLIFGF